MQFRTLILILFISFFANQVTFSTAETTGTYHLYVDSQFASESPDGSQEKPFLQLMDGLNAILQKSTEYTQITLYIAPSSQNYTLEKGKFNLDGKNSLNLAITSWSGLVPCNDQAYCSLLPVVDFTGYNLTLNNARRIGI